MFKKYLFALSIASLSVTNTSVTYAANTFSFIGGENGDGTSAPAGSWYAFSGGYYTPMRAVGSTDIPGPNGTLNFDIVNTLTLATSGGGHNSGNMIDRDAMFLGEWTAHSTVGALEITWDGTSNTATVSMSDWRWSFNGQTYDVGAGSPALLYNQDGVWGNGNDTLDYTSSMSGGGGAFGNTQYQLHLVGSVSLMPVPEPSTYAMILAGLGLVGFSARRKK